MSRAFALFIRIVSPLVSVWITYLVLANVALATHALELALNRMKPDRAQFEWKSAYTIVPFRVHARDFALRGQDDNLQWYVAIDHASVTFAPTDFFRKRIHMKNGVARGVSVRIRSRLEPAKVRRDFVEKLPEIPGYADPPLITKTAPKRGHTPWAVQLDDVIADDVREVWVDDVRFIDERGHVEGGFGIRPHHISMPPTKFVAGDMHVLVGDDVLASRAHGVFAVSVDDLDPKALRGITKLRKMVARAQVRARVGDWKALSYLIRSSHVDLGGDGGVVALDGELDHGVIAPHSRGELRSEAWRASAKHDAMSAAASTVFVRASSADVFHGSIQTYDYVLRRDGAVVATSTAVGFAYESHDLDVTKPPTHWGASIDVPTSSVPDLAALNGYLASQLLPHGTATFRGHADFSPHTARINFELTNVNAGRERGWWTSAVLSPMRFDGHITTFTVSGTSRDARLPLEILGAPRIVEALFGHQSFAFDAQVRLAPHTFDLERAHAAGDRLEVLARYEKRHHQQKRGEVLVIAPVMNVGVDIAGNKTTIKPFASRRSFDSVRR